MQLLDSFIYQLAVSRLFAIMPRKQTNSWEISKIFAKEIVHTVNDLKIIIDILKLLSLIKNEKNALLSLFLTSYHYSMSVFFPATGTKASAT